MLLTLLITLAVTTWLGCHVYRKAALRLHFLDHPNSRSAHVEPTPTGAGVVFATLFYVALCMAWRQDSGGDPLLRNSAIIALVLSLCSACTRVEDPIIAGIDSPGTDLTDHLIALQHSARAMQESGLARGRLAMAYDVNGLLEVALTTYQQAETLDPNDFRWPYFSAHVFAETGEYRQALEVLERALAIDQGYAPAWLWRGSWLLKTAGPDDALIAFKRAADLQAGPSADFGRAQALIAKGQHAQAIEILEPQSKLTKNPQVHRTLGEALRSVGRIEEASRALAKGKEGKPLVWSDERRDERDTHLRGIASYHLAQKLLASGRADAALLILERLQHYHPEGKCGQEEEFLFACELMNSFSLAYDRTGRPGKALDKVQRGLSINPAFIPFHLTIATFYHQERQLERSLDHINRAIELNPSRGYPHEERGRLLYALGRYDEAKIALETALQLEPEKSTTLFYLGLAESERANWPIATEHFQHVTRIEPDYPLGYVSLARSLGELGRFAEAWQAKRYAQQLGADPSDLKSAEQRLRELEEIHNP